MKRFLLFVLGLALALVAITIVIALAKFAFGALGTIVAFVLLVVGGFVMYNASTKGPQNRG